MLRNKLFGQSRTEGRPLGVLLIAIVAVAFGIVTALLGLLGMLTGFVTGLMSSPGGAGREFVAGLVGLILGAAYIFAGAGLLALRPWAWWLATLIGIVGFVISLGSPVWMIVWAALVGYLFIVRGNFDVRVPVVTQPTAT